MTLQAELIIVRCKPRKIPVSVSYNMLLLKRTKLLRRIQSAVPGYISHL